MPSKIIPLGDGKYKVETPNMVHAKKTTLEKAKGQARLLNAIDHGFVPTKKENRTMTATVDPLPPICEEEYAPLDRFLNKSILDLSLEELEEFIQECLHRYGGLHSYESSLVIMNLIKKLKKVKSVPGVLK